MGYKLKNAEHGNNKLRENRNVFIYYFFQVTDETDPLVGASTFMRWWFGKLRKRNQPSQTTHRSLLSRGDSYVFRTNIERVITKNSI